MKKIFIVCLIILNFSLFGQSLKAQSFVEQPNTYGETQVDFDGVSQDEYSKQLEIWKTEGLRSDIDFNQTISPSDFSFSSGASLTTDTQNYSAFDKYEIVNDSMILTFDEDAESPSFSFDVTVPSDGLFTLNFDYYSMTKTINQVNMEILINDEIQYYESSQITIDTVWTTPSEFKTDRFGNDTMPTASQSFQWLNTYVKDAARVQPEPLLFKLDEGANTITVTLNDGLLKFGQFYIGPQVSYVSYDDYVENTNKAITENDNFIYMEAEAPSIKNSVSIRYGTHKEPSVTPFGLTENRLNIIDGSSFSKSGQAIYYDVIVDKAGWYEISLKALNTKTNSNVFRTFTLDGKVPFEEALNIAIEPSSKWKNITLKSNDGEAFKFYLDSGVHQIGFMASAAPFNDIYETVGFVMEAINDLSLDIKKLTGNNIDENREWDILSYIPNMQDDLYNYAQMLEESYNQWQDINGTTKSSEISAGLKIAYEWLYDLSEKPNDVPKNLEKLATGSNSVMQRLGIILPLIADVPLSIDAIYVHGVDAELPKATANFFYRVWIGIRRFFSSFFISTTQDAEEGELEIWVNRSRQYVNLMQQMIDSDFTEETGIKVKISIMASEDKLILSTSSGANPDIAMGVAGWRPYDFAIRDAAYDLSEFDDFREISERFYEGAFTQLIYQDGVYGLPETQNFNLLFYRTDIVEALDLDIPDTWQDVVDLLPEIQRFGMNFYSQLSGTSSFKGFVTTMPFINQFGGTIYEDDVLASSLDDPKTIEAIKFMTDLYNIYSLPLEVGSFFNQFRYGNMPMGIGDFGMYIQLLHAAPEIAGLWDIALLPGVENDEGIVDRSYDGSSTSAMIFSNSDQKDESWEFLKWWSETETQVTYSEDLINAMGAEYMWNTSNYEAFEQLSWNTKHKDTFMEQWQWVYDTAKTPASYMLEREISNIWNKVVYDGENVRTAIEDATIIIDKEITRKMIEFKFIDKQGNVLKDYVLPTKDTLFLWVGENNG